VGEGEFYSHNDVVRDLYFGRGSNDPSITARLTSLEIFRENQLERQASRDTWVKSLVLLTITQTCLIIGGLITYVVTLKH
jgi:hypothetical protein